MAASATIEANIQPLRILSSLDVVVFLTAVEHSPAQLKLKTILQLVPSDAADHAR
jgi:hypothetical protein